MVRINLPSPCLKRYLTGSLRAFAELYGGTTPDIRSRFGISMSTASVDTDLPRSILICTLSGSNETCRPITAMISSRRTPSKSGLAARVALVREQDL